ncbi:MAG: Flp family type IVb pilin [Hyphomicrobiales bacterium]
MKKLYDRFVKDESGATAIEYGLIAAGISVAIVAILPQIGTALQGAFNAVLGGLGGGG